jgi:hypothetical protein
MCPVCIAIAAVITAAAGLTGGILEAGFGKIQKSVTAMV